MHAKSSEKPVDPEEVGFEEGEILVRLARQSVEYYFEHRKIMPVPDRLPQKLLPPGMPFVTIETFLGGNKRELRGCIGVTRPLHSLARTVIEVALESAFNDPRFPPLSREEVERVTFEVSVLSELEPLGDTRDDRIKNIVIGRDGLVVSDTRSGRTGLLLPVVPVEHIWDEETFLSQTCIKAGLWPDCWLDPKVKVYRYRAKAWREKWPRGPVEERDLREEYLSRLRRAGLA